MVAVVYEDKKGLPKTWEKPPFLGNGRVCKFRMLGVVTPNSLAFFQVDQPIFKKKIESYLQTLCALIKLAQ